MTALHLSEIVYKPFFRQSLNFSKYLTLNQTIANRLGCLWAEVYSSFMDKISWASVLQQSEIKL